MEKVIKKVAKVGLKQEAGCSYFVDESGDISCLNVATGKVVKVARVGIRRQDGYSYFVDKDGDISCSEERNFSSNEQQPSRASNGVPKGRPLGKLIKETKCTCQACGNIWFYGKQEYWQNKADRMQNFGKELEGAGNDMMCCGGCLPAAFLPKPQTKQVKDLNKCPKCNSSAVKKEEVTHEV